MKIRMRDVRLFQGTPLQIVRAMQDIVFGVDDFTVCQYVEWVAANALKFERRARGHGRHGRGARQVPR